MDLKGLVNKARATLQKNPSLIEKGGDAIDERTGGKADAHAACVAALMPFHAPSTICRNHSKFWYA